MLRINNIFYTHNISYHNKSKLNQNGKLNQKTYTSKKIKFDGNGKFDFFFDVYVFDLILIYYDMRYYNLIFLTSKIKKHTH